MHGFEIILFLIGVDTFVFSKRQCTITNLGYISILLHFIFNWNKRNNKQRNIESGKEFIDG